jgi:alpha-glucosidase (family GH31 glycosyl hydrolase)
MNAMKMVRRSAKPAAGALVALVAATYGAERPTWEFPDNDTSRQAICPPWAFEMWMWEDDINTSEAVWDMVDGCARHDLPLRAILIDSPWSTAYNDFVWDTKRYPEPRKMIDDLHGRGIKLLLWMTCMINPNEHKADCPGSAADFYHEAAKKGYLCNDGKLQKWWKGRGAFIDYTNPEALAWWHGLMDRVLLEGIDGWKVDGAGSLFFPIGGRGHKGPISTMEYVDLYYEDTYRHLISRNPEGVTMVRSVDVGQVSYGGRHAPRDAAPVTWVGDQSKTWDARGLGLALESSFRAMKKQYSMIGSDIGGYSGGRGEKQDRTLYLRWMQWSAFMPFFLNGGHGDHRPWMYDEEFQRIFRKFSWVHHELIPYLYSGVRRAHEGGPCLMQVLPGTWQYMLGDALMVAVIDEPTRHRQIQVPAGRWIEYGDNTASHTGPATIEADVPDDGYPVFIRAGSIIPLNVTNDRAGHGSKESAGAITLDVYPESGTAAEFPLWDHAEGGKLTKLTAAFADRTLTVRMNEGLARKYVLRVLADKAPHSVVIDGTAVARDAWRHDPGDHRLWITTGLVRDAEVQVLFD